MKRALLLVTIGVIFCAASSPAQNVFNPNDPLVRYVGTDPLGSATHPDPSMPGLQKWVSTPTNGVSLGFGAYDASSYKAYYMNVNGLQLCFRLKFPRSYGNPDSSGKKYPIMLFMHGAGEPGCPSNNGVFNNEKQLVHGGQTFRDMVDQGQFDGFLFYPQAQADAGCWGSWGAAPYSPYYNAIIQVVDSLAKYIRADVDKLLLTGLSDGGKADWYMTAVYPQRVAKAAISSAASPAFNYDQFVHIPIWFATGGKDTNPTPALAQSTYDELHNRGANIRWTLYPDLGHGVWDTFWAEPDFPAFMSDIHKANPLVFFQRSQVCPDSTLNVRIGVTAGFYAYEWQKNGVTIATGTNGVNTIIDGSSLISFTGNEITVKAYGTYRVRFRRTATADWSAFSPKPAVISPKPITQTPPIAVAGMQSIVLPAPDLSTRANLQMPTGYATYRWYQASDTNTVIASTRTYTAAVGQYRNRVTETGGCGTILSPVFKVVDATGSPKPDGARNLTATALSIGSVQLNWSVNPNAGEKETGFEVYRADSSGGPYRLISISAQGSTGYADSTISANARYYYIVRAIGNNGAAPVSNEATVKSAIDNQPPTVPTNVQILASGGTYAYIQWNASTDNIGVSRYDIFLNGVKMFSTPQTSYTITGLDSNVTYAMVIRARDSTGNVSQPSSQLIFSTKFGAQPGLNYSYYEGVWNALPDFNSLVPLRTGIINNVLFTGNRADNFGFMWQGYIRVPTSANYTFETCSDDGSAVYLGAPYNYWATTPVVNNDGTHTVTCQSNTVYLPAGVHPISIVYFQATGSKSITFSWQSDAGLAKQQVPDNVLFRAYDIAAGTIPATPGNLAATATSFQTIRLTWVDNSHNGTGFEIVRALFPTDPFVPIATVTGTSYVDSGLNASTAYYYMVRAIGTGGQSQYTTAVTATTQAAATAPGGPTGLAAALSGGNNATLSWNTNATTATGFEIWRSLSNKTSYRLINTIPTGSAAQRTYVDSSLFGNVPYYYKVRAVGGGLASDYSNEVTVITVNRPPKLDFVTDFTVHYDSVYVLQLHATDPDNDSITFSSPDKPYFGTFQAVSNGNVNLVFRPKRYNVGAYPMNIFISDGHNGKDSASFTVTVNNNGAPVLNPIGNVTMNEGDSLNLNLTATDPETTKYMQWTFKNMPAFVTFVNNGNGNGVLRFKPGYNAAGFYSITVIVNDGSGASTNQTFNLTVVHLNPNMSVPVKIAFYTFANAPWNNLVVRDGSPFNMGSMVNTRNVVTTVGVNSVSGSYTGSDKGAVTGNNSGVYPDNVIINDMEWGLWAGTNATDTVRLRVYGLNPKLRYNFVFFGSSGCTYCGLTSTAVTTYIIGNQKKSQRYYQNSTITDTIYQVAPDTSGQVFITMAGDPDPNIGGVLNALIIKAQLDDGNPPAKATNIKTQGITGGGVKVTWTDNAFSEDGYRVYRASSAAGPYTRLSPAAAADSTSFNDVGTVPFTKYYYYVVGFNRWGEGPHSDTVNITTGNNAPVVSQLNNMFVKTDATAQQDFTASDDPGDVVTVTILNKPSFVSLTSLGGTAYRIIATPTADNLGSNFITVSVADDKGAVVKRILNVFVADKNTRSVFLKLGWFGDEMSSPWNNATGYVGAGRVVSGLVDENNTATPFSITFTSPWMDVTHRGFNTKTAMGFMTGNNSGIYPDTVLLSGVMERTTTARQLTISGLNSTKRYNIIFMGSQNDGRYASATYSGGGQTDSLDAKYNAHRTANLNGLVATGGSITVSITKNPKADTMYLNGIVIEEYDPTLAKPLNPLYLYAEPKDMNTMWLSWTDRTNNETGFELQRSTDSLFAGNLVTISLPAKTTFYTNTGLSPNTKYWYRVRAIAGTASDWSNRTKGITPRSIVYLNFNFTVDNAPFPWNNTSSLPYAGFSFQNLTDQSNMPSGLAVTIEKPMNGENLAGVNTGSNAGIVPDLVLQDNYWIDNTQIATMRVSGLNQAKRYRVGFLGSMGNQGWYQGDYTATYSINGRTVYLNSWMNTSKIVYIGDVVPDMNGEAVLRFSTTPDANWGFNGGLVIEAYDDVFGGGQLNGAVQNPNGRPVVQEASQNAQRTGPDKIYPNPFAEVVNVDFNNPVGGNYISIDVYDLGGRLVKRQNYGQLGQGFNTLRLNTEANMVTGIYMITVNVNGKPVHAAKLVKVKN